MEPIRDTLERFVLWLSSWGPEGTMFANEYNWWALFALLLLGLVCGSVGALVIGNRMAFFSDALAHCAFSGVALGLIIGLILGIETSDFRHSITFIMVGFGILVGLLIAYIQEKTNLPSDTVIGVFFATALGLGALFSRAVRGKAYFNLESFIFGDPLAVRADDIFSLLLLVLVTTLYLVFFFNPLIFGSFNASLAASRRVPARLSRYLFVILLGVIVNLCQQTAGILLINGLLILPGATAANLSRNVRQLPWVSIGLAMAAGVLGLILSWEVYAHFRLQVGVGGMVILVSALFFVVSMPLGRRLRGA